MTRTMTATIMHGKGTKEQLERLHREDRAAERRDAEYAGWLDRLTPDAKAERMALIEEVEKFECFDAAHHEALAMMQRFNERHGQPEWKDLSAYMDD